MKSESPERPEVRKTKSTKKRGRQQARKTRSSDVAFRQKTGGLYLNDNQSIAPFIVLLIFSVDVINQVAGKPVCFPGKAYQGQSQYIHSKL